MKRRFSILASVTLGARALVACDDPSTPPVGSLELTASAPSVQRDVVTTDGWTITFERFLVHVSEVTVAGADEVVTALAAPQIFDLVAPTPKSLLASTNRLARPWEKVSLWIGPAEPETEVAFVPPVAPADGEAMKQARSSLRVIARISKGPVSKRLDWAFGTNTRYADCGEGGRPGMVVPADGSDAAEILLSGENLFSDSLVAPGAALRADAIAASDVDDDGVVTLDELRALDLEAARAGGAPYAVPEGSEPPAELGGFVEALSSKIVTRFRASGQCTAEPITGIVE